VISAVPISDCVAPVESRNPARDNPNGTFSYIDLSSVDKDLKVIDTSLVQNIGTQDAPSRARQLVKAGDILVSTVRPNLNGVAIVPEELNGATASTGYCVLRCNEHLDPLYLYYWVQTPDFVSDMVRKATGANYPAVTDRVIKTSTIPLPPLETQKHIARVLEQTDQLRKQAQQMESELNQLAQSLFLEMFGDPVTNPKGWPIEQLGAHIESIDSGWSPKCDDIAASEGEWGVLKLGAVTSCTYRETENKKLPSDLSPRPKIEVKQGDLLFSRKNTYDLVAASAYVRQTKGQVMLSDLIFRLVPKASLEPVYLWGLLTNPTFRTEVQLLAGGAAGSMPNISKSRLAEKQFPLASSEAQIRYVNAMQQLWSQLDGISETAQQLDNVFGSLMQRAFKGELTAPGSKAA
jgi:type I restriction enzyme S subunit